MYRKCNTIKTAQAELTFWIQWVLWCVVCRCCSEIVTRAVGGESAMGWGGGVTVRVRGYSMPLSAACLVVLQNLTMKGFYQAIQFNI